MNTPHRKTDTELIHLEIDELVRLNALTLDRANTLKQRLTPSVIEDYLRKGLDLSGIIDLNAELLNIEEATRIEPRLDMLFVTDWKAPWSSRPRKGHTAVTIWHKQTLLCKVTRVGNGLVEYEALTILEESGRPPTGARGIAGGAFSLDAIRQGRCTLRLPTPEQLAMLSARERDLGEAVADPEYRIPDLYARCGLTLAHTGGGCTGLAFDFTCGLHALVTSADDASAPTTDDEAVDVGVCDPDTGTDLDYRRCGNAAAAMRLLEELSAKYSPKDLPDPQQLARDGLVNAVFYIRAQLGLLPGDDLGALTDSEGQDRILDTLTCFGQSVIYGLLKRRGVLPPA